MAKEEHLRESEWYSYFLYDRALGSQQCSVNCADPGLCSQPVYTIIVVSVRLICLHVYCILSHLMVVPVNKTKINYTSAPISGVYAVVW